MLIALGFGKWNLKVHMYLLQLYGKPITKFYEKTRGYITFLFGLDLQGKRAFNLISAGLISLAKSVRGLLTNNEAQKPSQKEMESFLQYHTKKLKKPTNL
ncbi:Hypothetical predicted protein [Mytilus galloprovincialis]|uniref:Uncharacterized protein n=1 Tax=Mytilus galloprovincialis TaxID=29158 RepID=A0A8B6BFC8_MYTGA|nr:Hypothetical predicted protein [Mytilus galloprovincialis]